MARPRIKLDDTQIEALAKIGCTVKEIAAVMGCSTDTLERRYMDAMESGRENMKASVRRLQYKAAQDGNITMMIWLGKQYLGQKDHRKDEIEVRHHKEAMSDDELASIAGKASGGGSGVNQKKSRKRQIH